ncbi:hypothetical protein B4135_3055 [Caldibacillus debilis]|uniref:Uncharacterized protein n=1 Tax=Caldibacillus debilis TaxID=301148 RepID=A0A150LJD3_9BACI|nr:hypothetical protein B4135_3055 [Caldibacillus debilis]
MFIPPRQFRFLFYSHRGLRISGRIVSNDGFLYSRLGMAGNPVIL